MTTPRQGDLVILGRGVDPVYQLCSAVVKEVKADHCAAARRMFFFGRRGGLTDVCVWMCESRCLRSWPQLLSTCSGAPSLPNHKPESLCVLLKLEHPRNAKSSTLFLAGCVIDMRVRLNPNPKVRRSKGRNLDASHPAKLQKKWRLQRVFPKAWRRVLPLGSLQLFS